MYTTFKLIWVIIAGALILLILLHSPKGDGLGGISGQAQLFSSTKSAETTLNRLTWTLVVLFLGMTVVLSAGWIGLPSVPAPAPVTNVAPSGTKAPLLIPPTLPSEKPSK